MYNMQLYRQDLSEYHLISAAAIENVTVWRHNCFNVYCGPTIYSSNEQGLGDLTPRII